MFKRFFLFGAVNIGVMVMLMIIVNLLGLNHYLTPRGINYEQLAIFSLVWGMGGSFISLLISKKMVKWTMGVQIVDPMTSDPSLRSLVQTVHNLARSAGLQKMPEVGYYNSPELNAFATGPSKNNSLVAVSSGLYNNMSKKELEGVLGHEVAHIANGDMVTMTLIQGVMNAFVIFFAKAIAWAAAQFLSRDDDEGPSYMLAFAIEIVLQIIFGVIAMFVVSAFSRWREFRADRGGAELAGTTAMIAALDRLRGTEKMVDTRNEAMASMKISGKGGLLALLSTHPPLEARIERLRQGV